MTHGSLFSGIGGFDLAAEWMGWENVFHCEKEPFCQNVLKYYWPNAELFTDITKSDFTKYANTINILTGGFPCQPFSTAGNRQGEDDERYLFPEMLRAIREIKPKWVVAENVYGITSEKFKGVWSEIYSSLEAEGYEIQPYIIPASAVGAPHERYRIWFIAYSGYNVHKKGLEFRGYKKEASRSEGKNEQSQRWNENWERLWIEPSTSCQNVTNSECFRFQGQRWAERQISSKKSGDWKASWIDANGGWPTQPAVCGRNDGISARLDTDTISKKEWSESSLKGFGNAIVPQVAYEIFKAIEQFESMMNKEQSVQVSDTT